MSCQLNSHYLLDHYANIIKRAIKNFIVVKQAQNILSGKINTINNMIKIIDLLKNIIKNKYNPILILDIDDTCLSTQYGKKFTDKNITILANYVYDISPDNLWFLTARDYDYKRKTLHKLNRSGLLHKGKYINYNVIHSPYDNFGNPTKGTNLLKFITLQNNGEDNNWYIIIDDDIQQINDMYDKLSKIKINYSLFHFNLN